MNHPPGDGAGQAEPPLSPPQLHRAFRIVAGDLPPGGAPPFDEFHHHRPGMIDRRVILQTNWWVDRYAVVHPLTQMSPDYRRNVLTWLADNTKEWIPHARLLIDIDVALEQLSETEAREHRALLDRLPTGWSHLTPLGRRLHQLNKTHPPRH